MPENIISKVVRKRLPGSEHNVHVSKNGNRSGNLKFFLYGGIVRMLEVSNYDHIDHYFSFLGGIVDVFCGKKNSAKVSVVSKQCVELKWLLARRACNRSWTGVYISNFRETIWPLKSAGKTDFWCISMLFDAIEKMAYTRSFSRQYFSCQWYWAFECGSL